MPFISGKAGSPCVLLDVDGFRVEEPLPLPLSEEESSETRGLGVRPHPSTYCPLRLPGVSWPQGGRVPCYPHKHPWLEVSLAAPLGGSKRPALLKPEVKVGSLCHKLRPLGPEWPQSVQRVRWSPVLHTHKCYIQAHGRPSFKGLEVSGFDLKSDQPAACQRSLDTPRSCLGPGQCPLLPPAHCNLAPSHPLPTGTPPHSRPWNFSFLCLRKGWLHYNPASYPLPHCKQAQPNPGNLMASPRSAVCA